MTFCFLQFLFYLALVTLNIEGKKWQMFRSICVLMTFDHMRLQLQYIWHALVLCDIKPQWSGIFFFQTPPQNHPKISFLPIFFTYSYWSLCGSFRKNQVSGFWRNLGCAPYAQSWVFFSKCWKYSFLIALLLSL